MQETQTARLAKALTERGWSASEWNTGGGCMVTAIVLEEDGGPLGFATRYVWLDENSDFWGLGVYDLDADEEDEGVCVTMNLRTDAPIDAVADQVTGLLKRLHISQVPA